jgi:hypothetical protein
MSPEQSPDMPQGEGTAGNPPRGIPPLAQIKALRSIQAELNERTTELSKRVGDPEKVSQADQEELKELRRSQQEVAELFKKLAPQLQNPLTPEVP